MHVEITNEGGETEAGYITSVVSNSGNCIILKGAYTTATHTTNVKVYADDAVCWITLVYSSKPLFINFRYYVGIYL